MGHTWLSLQKIQSNFNELLIILHSSFANYTLVAQPASSSSNKSLFLIQLSLSCFPPNITVTVFVEHTCRPGIWNSWSSQNCHKVSTITIYFKKENLMLKNILQVFPPSKELLISQGTVSVRIQITIDVQWMFIELNKDKEAVRQFGISSWIELKVK